MESVRLVSENFPRDKKFELSLQELENIEGLLSDFIHTESMGAIYYRAYYDLHQKVQDIVSWLLPLD